MRIGSFTIHTTLEEYDNKTMTLEKDLYIRLEACLIACESVIETVYYVALTIFCHMNVSVGDRANEYLDWKRERRIYRNCASNSCTYVYLACFCIVSPKEGFKYAKSTTIDIFGMKDLCKYTIVRNTFKYALKKICGIAL